MSPYRAALWAIVGVVCALAATTCATVADNLINDPTDPLWKDILGAQLWVLALGVIALYLTVWSCLWNDNWFRRPRKAI